MTDDQEVPIRIIAEDPPPAVRLGVQSGKVLIAGTARNGGICATVPLLGEGWQLSK
jgi:hypothetical protein